MAIWSNLGKMASEATAKAVDQARVLSEVTKLNSQIADEEKRMDENYLRIGKRYVEIHGDDNEEGFSEMLAAVAESEKTIQGYKQRIQDVKGVVRCVRCGAEVAKNAAYCSACGEPMQPIGAIDAAANPRCQNCNSEITADMRFCVNCGAAVASPEWNSGEKKEDAPEAQPRSCDPVAGDQAEQGHTEETVTEADETPSGIPVKRVCANCGTVANENAAFCTECGEKL